MTISVFVGTSVDGFIARPDGKFDFLPDDGGGPENGFNEFYAGVDAVVIGRKTYEVVLAAPGWFYGKKRVVVLSTQALDLSQPKGKMEQMSGEPAEIVAKLAATGSHHLYVDGGETIQRFLRAGLVDRIIVTQVPVLIGEGIPLFGKLPHDVKLKHVRTNVSPRGFVQSEWHVAR